jgi:hypothetical protein
MPRVQIWVEVSEDIYHRYEGEARRREVPVEVLIEQTANCLMKEFEAEEGVGPDRTVLIS